MTAFDKQVGGKHYKTFKIQPIEFVMANGLGFCEGSIIKYVCRYKDKNGIQDLEKAKHYIEFLIEQEEAKSRSKEYVEVCSTFDYPEQEERMETTD